MPTTAAKTKERSKAYRELIRAFADGWIPTDVEKHPIEGWIVYMYKPMTKEASPRKHIVLP